MAAGKWPQAKSSVMDAEGERIADLKRQVETLGVAIERRTQIGIALVILIERLDMDRGRRSTIWFAAPRRRIGGSTTSPAP